MNNNPPELTLAQRIKASEPYINIAKMSCACGNNGLYSGTTNGYAAYECDCGQTTFSGHPVDADGTVHL